MASHTPAVEDDCAVSLLLKARRVKTFASAGSASSDAVCAAEAVAAGPRVLIGCDPRGNKQSFQEHLSSLRCSVWAHFVSDYLQLDHWQLSRPSPR